MCQNSTPISMVMVTKINAKIATNVVATIAMPTNNFVQKDLINVVPSPTLIKKLDNVNYLIFYNYDNQQD
jgi:hypothetical protein